MLLLLLLVDGSQTNYKWNERTTFRNSKFTGTAGKWFYHIVHIDTSNEKRESQSNSKRCAHAQKQTTHSFERSKRSKHTHSHRNGEEKTRRKRKQKKMLFNSNSWVPLVHFRCVCVCVSDDHRIVEFIQWTYCRCSRGRAYIRHHWKVYVTYANIFD